MPLFKRIKEYTEFELDVAVEDAREYCENKGLNFWLILNGIDAYMERRRRKELRENLPSAEQEGDKS